MKILLGVTGCIGAYKSALILRLLQKEGFDVATTMTQSARQFIGPMTLEKLSGHKVIQDVFSGDTGEIQHISWARDSDLLLVAPATANICAKFANGIADDFLSTVYLSTTAPVVLAPAMNVEMWNHAATRANFQILRERGVFVVGPESGYQACGEFGEGRLAEPADIVDAVKGLLTGSQSLAEKTVIVTAGGTIEDIDPVRFLSNRSTGKMGFAVAQEARRRGARVILISAPTHLALPAGVEVIRVRSAQDMASAVLGRFQEADVVVKAAAVSDYTPRELSAQKLKKQDEELHLELRRTVDILQELGQRKQSQILVGFAAESEQVEESARLKLEAKQLDLIVANDISISQSGFAADTNQVVLIDRQGKADYLPC